MPEHQQRAEVQATTSATPEHQPHAGAPGTRHDTRHETAWQACETDEMRHSASLGPRPAISRHAIGKQVA